MVRKINFLTLLGLIILFLIIAGCIVFLYTHHRVEVPYKGSPQIAARRNPYLAAQKFLTQQGRALGVVVNSQSGRMVLRELPPVQDVMIVTNLGNTQTQEESQKVLNWVRQGGHLITTAQHFTINDDKNSKKKSGNRVLDTLGVYLKWVSDNQKGDLKEPQVSAEGDEVYDSVASQANSQKNQPESSSSNRDQQANEVAKKLSKILDLKSYDVIEVPSNPSYEVAFIRERYLEYTSQVPSQSLDSDVGIHALKIPLGRGMVTVFSDDSFMHNPQEVVGLHQQDDEVNNNGINLYDHAYFLWQSVMSTKSQMPIKPFHIWLVYEMESYSIWAMLWQSMTLPIGMFSLLFLVWLWSQYRVTGPRHPVLRDTRRNLIEHIQMVAGHSWRINQGQFLLMISRQQTMQRIRQRYPHLQVATQETLCTFLAGPSQLSPTLLAQALYEKPENERQFVQISQYLQKLNQVLMVNTIERS